MPDQQVELLCSTCNHTQIMSQAPTPIQTNVFAVTVTVVTPGSGQAPYLQFNPDPVKMTQVPNALIVYYLVTPGFYFPIDSTAIVINNCADPSAVFPIAWVINASTLALGDYNNNNKSYKYTMTVVNSQTGARISTDPGIDNDAEK